MPVTDPNIVGYIVKRNGNEIARLNKNVYTDNKVLEGQSYIYSVEVFDVNGNVIENSNRVNVDVSSINAKESYTYLNGSINIYGNIAIYKVDDTNSIGMIKGSQNNFAVDFGGYGTETIREALYPLRYMMQSRNHQKIWLWF